MSKILRCGVRESGEHQLELRRQEKRDLRIAIIGTVGIPASYGGFETLVENLAKHHHAFPSGVSLTVYCSARAYPVRASSYLSTRLRYIWLNANGAQSVLYDALCICRSLWNRDDVILLLGVSGAIALPLVKRMSSVRIVTNVDGIEWRRQKWSGAARRFLRMSERLAVRGSDVVIADNDAIAAYLSRSFGIRPEIIAYGGDQATQVHAASVNEVELPENYALGVCRIEPENNVHVILEAFSKQAAVALVLVGNWQGSAYGRALRNAYCRAPNIIFLDPIYELAKLKTLRLGMSVYIHGHSAGGTNPSLVEAMHFGKAILAFDCPFNRATTEGKCLYFRKAEDLSGLLNRFGEKWPDTIGIAMQTIAARRYRWDVVAKEYFDILTTRPM